jgi:uncharacterized protein YjdB
MTVRWPTLCALVLLGLLGQACDEGGGTPPAPRVVTVVPSEAALEVGQSLQLIAATSGLPGHEVSWSSSAPAVASVGATGSVDGLSPGTAVVVATSVHDANARGTATIAVTAPPPPPPVEVRVSPPAVSIEVDGQAALHATVTGTSNTAVTWSSPAPEIATVDASGTVTGLAPGTVVVSARSVAAPAAEGSSVVVVTSRPAPEVVVAPSTAELQIAGVVQFTAIVVGREDQRVTWESSATGVVTVDSTGLARGVAPGAAVVLARPVAYPEAVGTAQVQVLAPPPPTAAVQSVTTATGALINPADVAGTVHVHVQATTPHGAGVTHARLSVAVPEGTVRVVETRAVAPGFSGILVFPVNTAAFDPATGIPHWTNGVRQFRIELLGAGGDVRAIGLGAPLVFANQNVLHMLLRTDGVAGPGTATVNGAVWHEGDVVVSALPVRYADVAYGAAELCVRAADGPHTGAICRAVAPDAGAFHATFRKADTPTDGVSPGVAGMATTLLRAYGTTALAAGGAGPAVEPEEGPTIRLDNLPPLAFQLALPGHVQDRWLNAAFTFTASGGTALDATATNVADALPGPGSVAVTFHAVPTWAAGFDTPANNAALVAEWGPVTAAAELESTASTDGYILLAAARDPLGNTRIQRLLESFGVDLVPPTTGFASGSAPLESINPPLDWLLTFSDEHSGMAATMVEYRMLRHSQSGGALRVECVSHAAGSFFTPVPAQGCAWVPHGSTIVPVPVAQGFYTAEFRVRDRAGNLSAPVSATSLRDIIQPTVTGVTSSATDAGFALTASLADDVGLGRYDVRHRFGGGGTPHSVLTVTPPVGIAPYGLPLAGARTVTGAAPLIRGLQVGVGGAVAPLDGMGFAAFDAAGNSGFGFAAASAAWGGIPATVTAWTLASSQPALCRSEPPAAWGEGTTATTTPTTQAMTAPGSARPFERVLFYFIHPEGYSVLIGTATTAASEDGVAERIWTWATTLAAAQLPSRWWSGPSASLALFAVAVTADGDALLAPDVTITVH